MAKAAPGAYAESIQEAVKNGAGPDQALKYATADVAMEIVTEQVPLDALLGSAAGDPKRAASIMDAALKQYGIRMTGEELNWLGGVAAEASGMQNHPAFAKVIALEMLKEQNYEQARTAASRVVWQQTLDWAMSSGAFEGVTGLEENGGKGSQIDSVSGKLAEVIDMEAVAKYDEENGQEVWDYGAGETSQGILRQGYPVGAEGGNTKTAGAVKDGDTIFLGEGLSEGGSGRILSLSDSGGITEQEYNDDFVHFDGRAGVDTEGKSISAESANRLRGTTVVDDSGTLIAVYHGTKEMDFTTFEKGDTGFHFGTYDQAKRRLGDSGGETGRMFRAYLNIQNPIYTDTDIGQWDAEPLAMYLHAMQTLTDAEYAEIHSLLSKDIEYDSDAAVRLCEILTDKGYDGVVYPNFFEGEGDSYMVFRDDQIIRSEITYFGLEGKEGYSTLEKRKQVELTSPQSRAYAPDIVIGKSLSAKAKNYNIMDLQTGEQYRFVEDTRIQNVEVFAGKGTKVEFRIAQKYADAHGGRPEDWQHVKGFGVLATPDGDMEAEVHWAQCPGVGKFDFFVKRWIGE